MIATPLFAGAVILVVMVVWLAIEWRLSAQRPECLRGCRGDGKCLCQMAAAPDETEAIEDTRHETHGL